MVTDSLLIFIDSMCVFLSFLIFLGAEVSRKYTYKNGGLKTSINQWLFYDKYYLWLWWALKLFNIYSFK